MNITQQDIKEFNELYKDLHTVPFSPERDMLVAATHDTLEMVEKYPEISTDPYIRNMFVADILSTEDLGLIESTHLTDAPIPGTRTFGKVLRDLRDDVLAAATDSTIGLVKWTGRKLAKAVVSTTRWLGVFAKRSATFANNALLSKHAIAKACARILGRTKSVDEKTKVKHGVTYKEMMMRAEKLIALCKRLSRLVRSQDIDEVGTPEFWNSFIGSAKYCVQVTKPKDGSPFPRLIWVTPKRENMWSLKNSEYANHDAMAKLSKTLQDLHTHGFVNLAEAATQCRKQCRGITEDLETGKDSEGSPKIKNFSRHYITAKLFAEVQSIVIKEIRYFTGTVKSELMKLKRDDSKYDKMIGSSAANETDKDDEKESSSERFFDYWLNAKNSDDEDVESNSKYSAEAVEPDTWGEETLEKCKKDKDFVEYDKAKELYDRLSREEQKFVTPNGKYKDSPNLVFRLGEHDKGNLIGFIDVYYFPKEKKSLSDNGRDGFIIMAVDPKYRGRGIAKKLLAAAVKKAKKVGLDALTYEVEYKNKPSINFIQKFSSEFKNETPASKSDKDSGTLIFRYRFEKDDDNDNKESKEMLTDILERAYASLEEMTTAKETSDKLQTYYNEFKPKGEELRGRLYAMLKKLASEDAVTATTKYLKVKCLNNPSDFVTRISERIAEQILFNDKVCGYETKQLNHDIAKRACEEHVRALDMVLNIKGITKSIACLQDRKDIKQAVNNYIQVTKHLWYSSRRLLANIRLHPHANEEDRKEAKEKREIKESFTEAKESLTYEQVINEDAQISSPGVISQYQVAERPGFFASFKKKDERGEICKTSNMNAHYIDCLFDNYYTLLSREINKPMLKFKGADFDSLIQHVHKILPTALDAFLKVNPLDNKPVDKVLINICKNTNCIDAEFNKDNQLVIHKYIRNVVFKDQVLWNTKWFNLQSVQLLHNCLRIVERESTKAFLKAYDAVDEYNKTYGDDTGMISSDQVAIIRKNVLYYTSISKVLEDLKFELTTIALKHIHCFSDYLLHH